MSQGRTWGTCGFRELPTYDFSRAGGHGRKAIMACDFFVVVTATFRTLYVFVIMELGARRIVHHNVTAHPTAERTLQQFREALPGEHAYRFVIHDRDRIYSRDVDQAVEAMGVRVLRTPVRAPKGNSYCEQIVRTARRECLDFLIPLSENHLKRALLEWVAHCNHARPHKSLGPVPRVRLEKLPQYRYRGVNAFTGTSGTRHG